MLDATSSLASSASSGLQGAGRGVRVLVVDDDRDTLMTLGILLRSERFEVCLLDSSEDVPSHVREFRPHLIVLDIAMPGRDGNQVARDLRAAYGDACPPLIALTGTDAPEEGASPFQHRLAKPYDPSTFLGLLTALGRPQVDLSDTVQLDVADSEASPPP